MVIYPITLEALPPANIPRTEFAAPPTPSLPPAKLPKSTASPVDAMVI